MEAALLGAVVRRRGPSSSDGKHHCVGSCKRLVHFRSRRNSSQPLACPGECTGIATSLLDLLFQIRMVKRPGVAPDVSNVHRNMELCRILYQALKCLLESFKK